MLETKANKNIVRSRPMAGGGRRYRCCPLPRLRRTALCSRGGGRGLRRRRCCRRTEHARNCSLSLRLCFHLTAAVATASACEKHGVCNRRGAAVQRVATPLSGGSAGALAVRPSSKTQFIFSHSSKSHRCHLNLITLIYFDHFNIK